MDQPKRISEEPVIANTGHTDRFVVLYGANTTSPSVRTISANNITRTLFKIIPTYANNSAAVTGTLPVGAVYKTANGELRIVI
jgi:hypothetical protein